jgi:hypothetical protein
MRFFKPATVCAKRSPYRRCNGLIIFTATMLAAVLLVLAHDAATKALAQPVAAPALDPQKMAEYRQKLAEYKIARQKFEDEAATYWKSIGDKRKARYAKRRNNENILLDDYVLIQPPLYTGPPPPVDPSAPAPVEPPKPLRNIPVVADFLKNAAEQFQFTPQKPASEIEFKRAYAAVASAAGLTKDQAVRIYGFEASGNGAYDVQAGLEDPNRPNTHAVSTALGYNQLLTTNSVELIAEQGSQFVLVLRKKAEGLAGPQRAAMDQKIAILQKMIDFSKTVPDDWSEHERLAKTPQGLGIHALNLDIDIGPLLQAQKLLNSVMFARLKKFGAPLSAAELEMMNLTGDGNGFDILTMPKSMRDQVPTSNFFQRGGYDRNPVASKNNTVSKLLAQTNSIMDSETALPGAKDLAAAFSPN